jgi:signal transduction histidine kinase/DNA-binding response OmpR family regulator
MGETGTADRRRASPTSSLQLTLVTLAVVVFAMLFLFVRLAAQEKRTLIESKRAAAVGVANLFAKALVAPLDLFDDESVREQLQHLRANPEVRGVAVWRSEFERPVVEYVPPRSLHVVRPANDADAHESVQDDLIVVLRPIRRAETSSAPASGTLVGIAVIEFSLDDTNAAIRASRLRILGLAAGLALFLAVVIGGVQRTAMIAQERVNRELEELNALKDEFLANTSHELRTPLNGIIGLTEALLDDAALATNTRRSLAMIGTSGRRLANLVNDILDFSKLEDRELVLQRRRLDVASIARRVVTLTTPLVGKKPVSLSSSMGATTPHVYADGNRVEQILLNLVGNAVKFTERGTVDIRATVEGDRLAIHVQDTGIGIPREHQHAVFRSFQQGDGSTARRYGGTGLGLSVTKKLVELHGGTIEVASTPGQGSTFTFTLPLAAEIGDDDAMDGPPSGIAAAALDGSIASASGRFIVADVLAQNAPSPDERATPHAGTAATRVLVVDDEPVNRAVLVQQLSARGYQLHEAADGVEAVEWIHQNGAPDVVLLDVMMPRLNGYDTLRTLRDTFPKERLPVLLLTAKNRENDVVEGFKAGANDYVTKPFTRSELDARVEHHLQLKRASEELEAELVRRRDLEGSIADLASREAAAHAKLTEVIVEREHLQRELEKHAED